MSLGSGPRRFEGAYCLHFKGLETPLHWVTVPDVSKECNAFRDAASLGNGSRRFEGM